MTYKFFILEHKTSGKQIISSFHNKLGIANPTSKDWTVVSNCIATFKTDSRQRYLRFKNTLKQIYNL